MTRKRSNFAEGEERRRAYTPEYVRLVQPQELRSLQSAVESATQGGVPLNKLVEAGGWERRHRHFWQVRREVWNGQMWVAK